MSTVSNDTRCCLVLLFCLRWTQLPTFQDDLHPHLVNDLHDSSRWKLSDLSPSFFFYPPSLFIVFVFPPFVLETASSSCDRQFPSSGLQVPFSPLLRDFCLELTLYFASATCDSTLQLDSDSNMSCYRGADSPTSTQSRNWTSKLAFLAKQYHALIAPTVRALCLHDLQKKFLMICKFISTKRITKEQILNQIERMF